MDCCLDVIKVFETGRIVFESRLLTHFFVVVVVDFFFLCRNGLLNFLFVSLSMWFGCIQYGSCVSFCGF